ncbi:hypothetical protein PAXRUDRAFT_823169 [Paxillus rubicundulus Ve08.2h10]|uniref:Uncharacterized protein n=1 Tax=Paxillus rubicundulus Ve08.2h10 TaxID=930991 RepID=A0A0D0ECB2_9AGAM|nr:hypothetical protein PAXRUDRAFT_823169 [Paxillus rubicundulus Ve08.2h10]
MSNIWCATKRLKNHEDDQDMGKDMATTVIAQRMRETADSRSQETWLEHDHDKCAAPPGTTHQINGSPVACRRNRSCLAGIPSRILADTWRENET